jgi:uncharacterized membrane protein YoaK (UPF0700 family)
MKAMMQGREDTAKGISGPVADRDPQRTASRRTAWVLASIALVFFVGVILAQYAGSPSGGIAVLGFAILGFLIVAIGRNERK